MNNTLLGFCKYTLTQPTNDSAIDDFFTSNKRQLIQMVSLYFLTHLYKYSQLRLRMR